MKMELRFNQADMTTNDDGSLTVSGYVNRTEEQSKMLGRNQKFKEIIKRGAWQRAIDRAPEIHFLAEHDKSKILSSTRNGSLELREDENGLYMEAKISPTSWGKDYYQLIKDGILNNMSFGFRAIKDSWRNMGDHFERTVNDLELFEVSVVRDPAYASSSISARGIDLVEDEVPTSELNLRTFEIRSDEDIEAIAKKIFEFITSNAKIAEQHKDEQKEDETEETVDEVEDKDKEIEDPVKTEETEDSDEDKTDKEDPVDETKDEDIVNKNKDTENPADKIRDFIKQHKTEEK